MWPFNKKKPPTRHAIHWHATLHCSFPDCEKSIPVEVLEISSKGARLRVQKLQIGAYHLFVGDPSAKFSLEFSLPEGTVEAPMEFLWYNLDEKNRSFLVDVDFTTMPDATKSALKKAIKHLTQTTTEAPAKTDHPEPAAGADSASETD
jgi:hypothetical protein